jgi:hypothetical protein
VILSSGTRGDHFAYGEFLQTDSREEIYCVELQMISPLRGRIGSVDAQGVDERIFLIPDP